MNEDESSGNCLVMQIAMCTLLGLLVAVNGSRVMFDFMRWFSRLQ